MDPINIVEEEKYDKWYVIFFERVSEKPLNYPKFRLLENKLYKNVNCKNLNLSDD